MTWRMYSTGAVMGILAVTIIVKSIMWYFQRKDLRRFQHLVKGKVDL